MLRGTRQGPDAFTGLAGELFRAMSTGDMAGFEPAAKFNGNLFNDAQGSPCRAPCPDQLHHPGRYSGAYALRLPAMRRASGEG